MPETVECSWATKQVFAESLVHFCSEQTRMLNLSKECQELRERIFTLEQHLRQKTKEIEEINSLATDTLKNVLQKGNDLQSQMLINNRNPTIDLRNIDHERSPPRKKQICVAFNDRNGCRKRRNDCWQVHRCRKCSSTNHGGHYCPHRTADANEEEDREEDGERSSTLRDS